MPVFKVSATELLGDRGLIMFGEEIPAGWREGFRSLAARNKAKKDRDMIAQLLDAALFAAHKHSSQRRKDAEASPYINHPLALAQKLATTGGITDPDILCAALLHDTVEDTETSFGELEDRFGSRIAGIVREVTDDKTLEKPERKQLQVEKAAAKSTEAKLVKLADKISNLGDILRSPPADWSDLRKLEYFEWATLVVDRMRGTSDALETEFDELLALGRSQFGGA